MSNFSKKLSNDDDTNDLSSRDGPVANSERAALAIKSEDIQILDNRITKYFILQDQIREVIRDDSPDKDALINDIVDTISKLSGSPILLNIVSFGIVPVRNHLKRKKLRKVIENILKKIFDITLGWYVMDYEDVRETCAYIGGKGYFGPEDHRHIYIAVRQRLMEGPIRDKCIKLRIWEFVNEKLIDIRNNFLRFKATEL